AKRGRISTLPQSSRELGDSVYALRQNLCIGVEYKESPGDSLVDAIRGHTLRGRGAKKRRRKTDEAQRQSSGYYWRRQRHGTGNRIAISRRGRAGRRSGLQR